MPKVSEEHRQARRDQIAQAAVELFLRHGIHGTTTANITEESGLSAGAIYTHFASKDEIIAYVANRAITTVLAHVERATESDPLPSPAEVLQLIVDRIPTAGINPGLIVQLWGEAVTNPAVRQTANRAFTHARDTLSQYFTLWLTNHEGVDLKLAREQAAPHARLLVTVIYSCILQASLLDDADPVTLITDLHHLFDGHHEDRIDETGQL